MAVILDRLHTDHRRLARILELLDSRAAQCAAGARGSVLDSMASLVDYISEYPDAVHHPMEDRVFSALQDKRLTDEEQRALAQNVAQHELLTAATTKLAADIDAVLSSAEGALADLARDVQEYVTLQREHMRNEEQRIFPLAEREFSEADWRAQEVADEQTHDPLFDQRLSRFESLLEYALDSA